MISECSNYYGKPQDKDFSLSTSELLKFVGVLYFRGVFAPNKSVAACWSEKYGTNMIRGLMNRNRFQEIIKYLRFDDNRTRHSRVVKDKFALIREVWGDLF